MAEADNPKNELKIITIKIKKDVNTKLGENYDFFKVLKEYDVILLQESNLGENRPDALTDRHELDCQKFGLNPEAKCYLASSSSNERGVGIIINTKHKNTTVSNNEGNYIMVETKIKGEKFRFVSFYYHENEEEVLLYRFVNCIKGRHGIRVIGGDFNLTIDPFLDIVHDTQFHIERRKIFNRIWPKMYTDVWRYKHPDEREYTVTTPREGEEPANQQTRLDYFFMKKENIKLVKACEILPDNLPTDHKAVSLTLRVPDALEKITKGVKFLNIT